MLRGSRAPLIAGVGALVLVGLLVFFLVLPKMGQVSDANAELTAAQAQQGTLESQLAALEQAEAAAPEAKATIQEVEQQIPPTADEPGMLLLIKNAATDAGVTLATLTPGTPTLDPATGLSTIPVAVTASGGYFQLTEFLYGIETLPRAAKVLNVTLAPGAGSDTTTTTTVTNLLQLQANVVLYTSDQSAGPGSEPGPTEDAAAAGEPEMPLTPRDRRTLMIGGGVLGVLLVGFLLMNVLSGGGGDEAIPTLPPITVAPGDDGASPSEPSPTGGVSPIPVFTGRDPFSIPPALSPTTATPPPSGTTTPPPSGTTTPPPSGTTSPPPSSPAPTAPGGGSSQEVGGKTVVLLSVFSSGGQPMVQVEVDGQVFNNVGIGDTFDNGRYELRSVSGDCATFLYGDESFTLCANSTK